MRKEAHDVALIVPAIVATVSVDGRHTIIANRLAAYELDGTATPSHNLGLRKGQAVLMTLRAPMFHVRHWNGQLFVKEQRIFDMQWDYGAGSCGRSGVVSFAYSERVRDQLCERMFWELHGAMPVFGLPLIKPVLNYDELREVAESPGLRARNSLHVLKKDGTVECWPSGSIGITYPEFDQGNWERFRQLAFQVHGEIRAA